MINNKNKKEQERESGKKMHEQLDSIITKILNGPKSEAILTAWAETDPKGFSQLAASRMPKVQPIDQDLQRTLISLKSIMLPLPDVEDIILAFKKCRVELGQERADKLAANEDRDLWRKKYLKLKKNVDNN